MKYQYMLIKEYNEYADRDVNKRLELMSPDGWQLYDWKANKRYTILLFRKEVTNESDSR